MADLDTENKRRAALQFAPFTIMPVADGDIAAADRAQAAWIYSGIEFDEPAVSTRPKWMILNGKFYVVGGWKT